MPYFAISFKKLSLAAHIGSFLRSANISPMSPVPL